MKRRLGLVLLAAAAIGCGGGGEGPATPEPITSPANDGPETPNVVLIFVDDLGWGDLSSYGHPVIRTPHIDALGQEGVRLLDFSTPTPVCAPSRAAILTGRYPVRVGVPWNPPERLNDDELTVADLLRSAGYVTGMVGKWHLGWRPPDLPTYHGFDSFYGKVRLQGEILEGDQPADHGVALEDLTWQYTQKAVAFIHENRSRRFFLYVAYHAPHSPHLPSDTFAGTSAAGDYGDVVEELDWGVGEIAQALEDTGLERDTLVFFASDNGPEFPPGSAGPFRGGKGWPTEGGVRVPAVVRWPVRIPAGTVIEEITSTLDFLPTAMAAAGSTLPSDRSYDGVDLSALLAGEVSALEGPGVDGRREQLYYRGPNAAGIRSGRWKLLKPGFWRHETNLYDLETDPGERFDRAAEYPDLVKRLSDRMDEIPRSW